MFDLGIIELVIVGFVLIVFVGPDRLPYTVRTLGRMYGKMRRAADELRRALVLEADRLDEEERLKELREKRKQAMEARKKAESEAGDGSRAQPEVSDTSPEPEVGDDEHGATSGPTDAEKLAEDYLPPGFTRAEWDELPDHIKEIVQQRRKDE